MPNSQKDFKAIVYTSSQRSIYIGRAEQLLKRCNVTSTAIFSLGDALSLRSPKSDKSFESKSFILPAGSNTVLDTRNQDLAMCFLDDLNDDLRKIKPFMCTEVPEIKGTKDSTYADLAPNYEAHVLDYLLSVFNTKPEAKEIFDEIARWERELQSASKNLPDARVERAVSIIKANYDQNIPVEHLASQVNLSTPRLVQLFKKCTGSPIRRYRQWHRIFATAVKISGGATLTEAAISSGFSDYAQFSRVYRDLVGASPSAARDNIEIRPYQFFDTEHRLSA